MELINWGLSAIDTIFSSRNPGSEEETCPAGTFPVGYALDSWAKWRAVCLSVLSVEDAEDVFLFGLMVAGIMLIEISVGLVYRKIGKIITGLEEVAKLPGQNCELERLIKSQMVAMCDLKRAVDNNTEKLCALRDLGHEVNSHTTVQADLARKIDTILDKITTVQSELTVGGK